MGCRFIAIFLELIINDQIVYVIGRIWNGFSNRYDGNNIQRVMKEVLLVLNIKLRKIIYCLLLTLQTKGRTFQRALTWNIVLRRQLGITIL